MKYYRGFVICLLLFGLASVVEAAKCPSGQTLRVVGASTGVTSGNSVLITASGADVQFISGVCTTTACAVTLYDSNDEEDGSKNVDANAKFHTGAAASAPFVHDLLDTPIEFNNGIVLHDDGNLQGISLLACKP